MALPVEHGKTIALVVDCPDCNGTGADYTDRGGAMQCVPCARCGGAGWFDAADDDDFSKQENDDR